MIGLLPPHQETNWCGSYYP